MHLTRRWSALLLGFGAWTWFIWPNFLRAIWRDERAWQDGPTAFFLVHAVLISASLAFGTAIGVLGWLGLRAGSRS